MKIEIECKLHLEDPEKVLNKLREIGAEDQGEVYEKNWTFDKDSTLIASRSLLRLRIHNDDKGGILTHKTPATTGKFKSKHETETYVDDAANMRLILENLGYQVCWYYEKRRRTLKTDGLTVVIDTTPELGVFIEIEGETDNAIESLLNKIGLNINSNIMSSYPTIWRDHCQNAGIEFCDWKFSK